MGHFGVNTRRALDTHPFSGGTRYTYYAGLGSPVSRLGSLSGPLPRLSDPVVTNPMNDDDTSHDDDHKSHDDDHKSHDGDHKS